MVLEDLGVQEVLEDLAAQEVLEVQQVQEDQAQVMAHQVVQRSHIRIVHHANTRN